LDNYFNGKEVHRTLFLDPSLFEREQQQVFAASWCYLGHESLVPETGDFFTGEIAGQPLANRWPWSGRKTARSSCCTTAARTRA